MFRRFVAVLIPLMAAAASWVTTLRCRRRLTTSGLGSPRDAQAAVGSPARTVDVNFSERFTVRAQAEGSATQARLTATRSEDCQLYPSFGGARITHTADLGTVWTAAAAERILTIDGAPPCGGRGTLMGAARIAVRAEARDPAGATVSSGLVTYH